MGSGRERDPDRPVEPDEARAQGNDPDAVRMSGDGPPEESAPRRVGDVREDQAVSDADRDTATAAAAAAQEGWNVPTGRLPAIGSQDLPEPIPVRQLLGASVVILATALGSGGPPPR